MERRDCAQVIQQMLDKIPSTEVSLIKDLKEDMYDASFKAPEQNVQWIRTASTLDVHIPGPTQDWEFEVLSIFTTRSIEELKNEIMF